MLYSINGIVLHYINYSDTSIIAKIYTDKFGLQSYIVNGVRKKKAQIRLNIFQALNLLEMEVVHKEKLNLQRIKEVKATPALLNISADFLKSTLALFLKELIYKSIKEEEPNPQLFTFLKTAILYLETTTENIANFHVAFLLELTKYLGFYPDNTKGKYFNIEDGIFQEFPSSKTSDLADSKLFKQFLETDWKECHSIKITGKQRQNLLYQLLEFYKTHIESFGKVKSLDVLQTVMN